MTKSQAIQFIDKNSDYDKLIMKDSTFANISRTRNAWWMNIKLESFNKDWNILLVSKSELFWLKIPANTFRNLSSYFQIWESKKSVDIYISCDPNDRYFKDIASRGSAVDFKKFLFQKFAIPEALKDAPSIIAKKAKKGKAQNGEINTYSVHGRELKPGQRILKENEVNVSYKNLFADYLKGAKNIIIQDPYIRYPHQFKNLLEFCFMLGKNKGTGEIKLEIVTWNSEEFYSQSKGYFDEVVRSVSDLDINLSYRFEEHHDRYIEADNGWKIVLGRGLDIFKRPEGRFTIADIDQMSRKCKACEITFLQLSDTAKC